MRCNVRILSPNTRARAHTTRAQRTTRGRGTNIIVGGGGDYTRGAIFPNELDVGRGQRKGERVCLDARLGKNTMSPLGGLRLGVRGGIVGAPGDRDTDTY